MNTFNCPQASRWLKWVKEFVETFKGCLDISLSLKKESTIHLCLPGHSSMYLVTNVYSRSIVVWHHFMSNFVILYIRHILRLQQISSCSQEKWSDCSVLTKVNQIKLILLLDCALLVKTVSSLCGVDVPFVEMTNPLKSPSLHPLLRRLSHNYSHTWHLDLVPVCLVSHYYLSSG